MKNSIKDMYRSKRYTRKVTCPLVSDCLSQPHFYPAPWNPDYYSKQGFDLIYKIIIVVHSLSGVWVFAITWTAAHQAPLSFTISQSYFKPMSIKSVILSNHLILCCPLLLLPYIFPSIRVFSNESALHIRWPKYWSFNFSISPFNEYSGLISLRID